ncbi:mucin-2 isoform X1 [Anastrepha obliqua]|uniref:mucin-2 isoform X1 n=1 Tax=Anastrepha obliqua TaxID=95512 RepID=UPI00240A4D30|nr:mucin-2 isoform X1 [Anastrepha obliqua]
MKPFDKYQDIEQGGYAKFTGLKTYNKQLKTMIAIGGWNEASSRFSPLMANPERRQKFIKNILKFLRQNHFDGIDLDWEYPAQREGGKERDRDNYAQFVQELRAEFEREAEKTGRPRLLLTMAVPAGIENIEKGYDIPKLNKYLDWFNVLSYDFHSSHEPSANHHAPLYSLEEESEYNYDAELNIDYSIKYYLKAGADRDKLVLGIPTYGRSYTLINEESTEIGAPSEGPGEQGDATREKGYLAYYEICQNLKEDPEWTVVQPNPNAMGPYAYRRNQWVGYDDEAIVRKKAQYVVEHGLGGIMFWAIDNDDFRGTCSGKPYPLIEAAKESMLESLGLGINEVAKPNAPKKPSRSRSRENSSSKLNRIGGSSEGKGSSGRVTLSSGRRRVQSSPSTTTTREPETTIRLTNPEGSSLYIGGRVTTPAPPTTPDPGTDFKCEEEGFFQHPRDCKKYYWCLDSGPSGLGIVGHMFTCPSGLYFNPAADSCDFARNVPCKIKKTTTAAPISSTTTTTTTPRPTASINRISAATSRTSFFRTTTPTTTTPTPIEYEDEEEEIEEDVPTHFKDREAEEDPQVIKELIELIRKVGGIEELEKHLLRKDDGTISIKSSSSESNAATTQSPISKSLYDKVLSKPNSYNSIRNRFTSSSLFRKSSQANTEQTANSKFESDESQVNEGSISSGFSKYSSVVRGNSRQGPQNEGLDKLSEFDGFLKEKKQYVTINRNRGSLRGQEDEDDVEEKQVTEHQSEDDEEVELKSRAKTTRRPTNTVTPSYASIRRARPSTVRTETEEEAVSDEEVKTSKENEEKRAYTSLNRNRGRYTSTESSQKAEEVITNANRYKYLERPRPQNRLKTTFTSQDEESLSGDDEEDQEEEQNVTVQLNRAAIDSTQKSTQSTTRIYASIGRRTTTTTTETPTTQETPTRYNLLENTFNNETPEPILPNTTTATTANDSPTLSITIKNTNPEIISTVTTSTSSPTISTTNASATTITSTTSNDNELVDALPTITTLPPTFEHESKQPLDLSLDVNSLIEKTASTANPTTASATEKLQTEGAETTTARTTTTTETLTSTATTTTATDTDQPPTADETDSSNIITTTESAPTNEFLGTVSSPRPFGFPRRRTRPNNSNPTNTEDTKSITESIEDEQSVAKTRLSTTIASKTKKYQFNRSRFSTTTTTTIAPTTIKTSSSLFPPKQLYQPNKNRAATTANQVNALVDDEDDDDEDGDNDNDEEDEDEDSTTTTTESTLSFSPAPTLKRIRVLKYRRPIGGSSTFSNATLVNTSVSDSSNFTFSSVTNTTNTVSQGLDTLNSLSQKVGRTRLELLNSQDSNTNETQSESPVTTETKPTKRFRKVIRKLIRPVNRTIDSTLTNETKSDDAQSEASLAGQSRFNATRYGLGREGVENTSEISSENSTSSDSNLNSTRTILFGRSNRARFGNRVTSSNIEKSSENDDGVFEADSQTETEEDSQNVTANPPPNVFIRAKANGSSSSGIILPSRRPFVLTRVSSRTKAPTEDVDVDDENENEDEDEGVDTNAGEEGDEVQETSTPAVEQYTGIPRNRLTKLTFTRNNLTKSAETNIGETAIQEEQRPVVATTRLRKLLPDVTTETIITTNELEESDDRKSSNATQAKTALPRRPFGLASRTKPTQNESGKETEEDENTDVTTARTPLSRPTFRRKLVARRPYTPPKVSGITISTTIPTSPKPRRKFVRRKFGRFHPFNAVNRNTGEGFVRTDPRSQLLPETKRFRVENGKRVPIPNGETLSEDEEYEEYEDESEEEEEKESNTATDQNKSQIPVVTLRPVTRPSSLFNRPPTTLLKTIKTNEEEIEEDNEEIEGGDEDEEEDEDDEEGEGEEEETHALDDGTNQTTPKLNTPALRTKDNRVPPGSRPALPASSTQTSGNVPFNGRGRQPSSGSSRFGTSTSGNRFGSSPPNNTRATNRPRIVNLPQGVVPPNLPLKPIATSFERTTPVIPTKPAPFIPTNTRSYERRYTATSTETPENYSDNSLIEDLNIEALNARNKKIFDINSKKHTTLKPKIVISGGNQTPTDQQQDTQDHIQQNTETEDDDEYTSIVDGNQGYITTTPRTPAPGDTNTDYYINANEISSQDNEPGAERTVFTTPQTPTTTLLHVFTLTEGEQTNRPPTASANTIGRFVPERARPKHKVVEINRIVEITSKEDKLRRKSKANQEFLKPIGASNVKVESLPHVEQLGEISVVKFVHLVDGSDISIDGHSTVTDYTPTEPTVSIPVRNSLPDGGPYYVPQYAYSTESAQARTTLEQRNGKALIPEVIRSAVETSTISLEGLFDSERKGKELNSVNSVYYIFGSNDTISTSTVSVNENETQNSKATTLSTSTSTPLPTFSTLLTTTTESALPLIPISDSINNIPNEAFPNLEFTTIVGNNFDDETTTTIPNVSNTTTEATITQTESVNDVSNNLLETTTSKTVATDDPTSVDTAVKSSTYVRPVVPLPLLRPESNESSPLIITIANLDKVILSKVDRTISVESKSATNTVPFPQTTTQPQLAEPRPTDSSAEYSSRFASVVEAPTNLIQETGATTHHKSSDVSKNEVQSVGSSNGTSVDDASVSASSASSISSGSIVKEMVSFSTETHVVRKKKSRKHRARRMRKSRKRTTTMSPTDAPAVTITPKIVNNEEEYQSSSSSTSVTESSTAKTTPRVRVVNIT